MPGFGDYLRLSTSRYHYESLTKATAANGHDVKDKPSSLQRPRSASIRLPRPTRRNLFVLFVLVFVLAALALGAWKGTKRSTRAVPSPRSLGSDLVTYYDNDLLGRASVRTADSFLFLSGPVTRDIAKERCSAIGEKLLSITNKTPDRLLRYMTFLDNGTHPDLKYWVAEKTGSLCHALTHDGLLDMVNCKSNLTTLCTQSALISQEWDQNSSPRWRVKVGSGNRTFTGYRDRLGFRFQGIRYAPKPVRFEHSRMDDKPGHSDALRPGPKCIQKDPGGSEDCLSLNIFTPYLPLNATKSRNLKPVMFWLHGGAFEIGTGADPIADGGNLASRGDVVVVTHNYRLGTLGFLTLNDSITTGNYGLGDSVTALDWTRANIRSFGGDPNRITIFGQSAGAALVRALLQSPKAIGKYHGAIMQSNLGGYDFAEPYSQYYSNNVLKRNFTDSVLKDTKCHRARSPLICLRAVPAQRLATTSKQASYLAVDNLYLSSRQLLLNASVHSTVASNASLFNSPDHRRTANVPLLLGTMVDDATLFLAPEDRANNLSRALRHNTFNASVLSHPDSFPIINDRGAPPWREIYSVHVRAGNDAFFRCVDQATAYAAARHSTFPSVYYYEFDRSYMNYASRPACNPPPTWTHPEGDPEYPGGYLKCHSGDLIYVFGNLAFRGWADRDGWDARFAQGIVDAWSAFAWSGNPNPNRDYLKARGFRNSTAWVDGAVHPGNNNTGSLKSNLDITAAAAAGKAPIGVVKRDELEDRIRKEDESFSPGPWLPVNHERPMKRILRRSVEDIEFNEVQQCADLGIPLEYFA